VLGNPGPLPDFCLGIRGKGGPFMKNQARGPGGMLIPQGNFLKMDAQKSEFGNFSATK